ncbi:MAG: hypothetical protein MR567_07520, partial [Oscillospiraceae bacterium]|nr:hypothetical protein [Oscillospiraceae bacterium]
GSDLHRSVYLICRSVGSLLPSLVLFFYLCANAARAFTFFQTKKKVNREVLLVRIFSAEFFLALRARKKLRVENAIGTLFYRPIFFGVRHSGIPLKGTKFSNGFSVSVSHSPSMPDVPLV